MSFAALPAELRLRIIKESIQAQLVCCSASSATQTVAFNVQQAITLAQVSRICHAIVVELLYYTIRITRPSSLMELRATLSNSPHLAPLILNLHIGAVGELPQKGWPIDRGRSTPDDPHCSITTTLAEGELPSWCAAGTKFNIGHPELSYPAIAVDNALHTALRDIDVDPWQRGKARSGTLVGVRAWAARLCLLQATLDVYLIEAKRVDYARWVAAGSPKESFDHPDRLENSETPTLAHYPWLLKVLLDASPTAAPSDKPARANEFTVSAQQLWDHLLKRGGPADHFDHLVRLTRSSRQGLGMTSKEEWSRVRRVLSGPDVQEGGEGGEEEGEKKKEAGSEDEHALVGSASPSSMQRLPLDGHRVEDLLDAARDILGLTSNIKSLSLTSYFHRALSSPTPLTTLRSLVLGPRTLYWDDVLPPVKCLSAFKNLKRLRVVGKITEDDAFKIAYEVPSLREVEWEMPERSIESSSTIYDTIDLLQGLRWSEDEDASGEAPKAGQAPSVDSSFTAESKASDSSRLNTIHLHPHIIIRVLGIALLESGKHQAWKKGTSVPGTSHRVKIADSDVMSSPAKLAVWDETDFLTLMKRSLEWWEEGGKAGGRGD